MILECQGSHSQSLDVAIWYILKAQRGSHITTLGPKYIPCSYMEPLGFVKFLVLSAWVRRFAGLGLIWLGCSGVSSAAGFKCFHVSLILCFILKRCSGCLEISGDSGWEIMSDVRTGRGHLGISWRKYTWMQDLF